MTVCTASCVKLLSTRQNKPFSIMKARTTPRSWRLQALSRYQTQTNNTLKCKTAVDIWPEVNYTWIYIIKAECLYWCKLVILKVPIIVNQWTSLVGVVHTKDQSVLSKGKLFNCYYMLWVVFLTENTVK